MRIKDIIVMVGTEEFNHDHLITALGKDVADKIAEKSGFHQRYRVPAGSDILEAGRDYIMQEGLHDKIAHNDFVIVVSEYTEKRIPPPSAWLLRDVNLQNSMVIDLNRGCSGFCEALIVANSLFRSGRFISGVIITAENYSKIIGKRNRTLSPIFSDAVGFTFIESGGNLDYFYANYGSFHQLSENLSFQCRTGELFMNGAALVAFLRSTVVPRIVDLLKENILGSQVDHLVVHQGSALVVDTINSGLINYGIRAEFLSAKVGNLNSSSIPFVLSQYIKYNKFGNSSTCLLSGFGVGLSFCNVLLNFKF